MERMEYAPKGELEDIARELLDFLRPKELPVWQVKEVLDCAKQYVDYTKLK